jgi:hypothetical protein
VTIPQKWRSVATSVIGTSHLKSQSPCQDAHAISVIDGQEEVLVLIASDGAGSASHSEVGARLACQELLSHVRVFLNGGGTVAGLSRSIVLKWLEGTAQTIETTARDEDLTSREFACTLLVALLSPTHAAYLQIGDGAMVVRSGIKEWSYVFWPQHGEYINTTVFLTDPTALANFNFEIAASEVAEIAIFTDGLEALLLHYATQTVHGPFFDATFPAVRALPNAEHSESLSSKLALYLSSAAICERTDDDKTLLLATRLQTMPELEPSQTNSQS